MGNLFSRIHLIIREFLALIASYQELEKRLNQSPGLPVSNPSQSFWTVPKSPIAKHLSELPKYADIVVIGSGLTGTSFTRTALGHSAKEGSLQIVMLDARDACCGASGRNGGHVNPVIYDDYEELKRVHGMEAAKQIIKFRLRHFPELRQVVEEEDMLEETRCRSVEHSEVYYDRDLLEAARRKFKVFEADMPEEAAKFEFYEAEQAIERFGLSSDALGCVTTHGGAIHPYKFVTGLLARMLRKYPENFHLLTNTPCTTISPPTSTTPFYTVTTSRGTIRTAHVVHATNGHVSHLLPSFRSKVVSVRATMSAQRPGTSLGQGTLNGLRTFVFFRQKIGFDYMTQLDSGEHELMVGGGLGTGTTEALHQDVGNADDSHYELSLAAHLSGIVPVHFGEKNWGAEKQCALEDAEDNDGVRWSEGRVKAIWSGTVALSADFLPWVGRLPVKLAERRCPPKSSTPTGLLDAAPLTAAPGEWISASYSGEGMTHAWLCARALAYMVLGAEEEGELKEWFPDAMRVSVARWKKADAERMLAQMSGE